MTRSYSILFHKSFRKQAETALSKNSKKIKRLETALEKIQANPSFGKMMEDIFTPKLQGIIRRVHVGGRKGHRLIYLHPHRSNFVIPVLISSDPKPPWEYDDVDWEELSETFYKDYTQKNYDSFLHWPGKQTKK